MVSFEWLGSALSFRCPAHLEQAPRQLRNEPEPRTEVSFLQGFVKSRKRQGRAGVDASAVARLLEWRRQAARRGKTLEFVNLPPNLLALATLYGVAELIQPNLK